MLSLASTKACNLIAVVQEFERLIDQPESPIRALRHQPARRNARRDPCRHWRLRAGHRARDVQIVAALKRHGARDLRDEADTWGHAGWSGPVQDPHPYVSDSSKRSD